MRMLCKSIQSKTHIRNIFIFLILLYQFSVRFLLPSGVRCLLKRKFYSDEQISRMPMKRVHVPWTNEKE